MRLTRLMVAAWIATSGIRIQYLEAQDQGRQARAMELKGDGAEARTQLQRAANAAPNDPLALEAYAEFLDHHRDPQARATYEKLRQLLARNGASPA